MKSLRITSDMVLPTSGLAIGLRLFCILNSIRFLCSSGTIVEVSQCVIDIINAKIDFIVLINQESTNNFAPILKDT